MFAGHRSDWEGNFGESVAAEALSTVVNETSRVSVCQAPDAITTILILLQKTSWFHLLPLVARSYSPLRYQIAMTVVVVPLSWLHTARGGDLCTSPPYSTRLVLRAVLLCASQQLSLLLL